MSPPFPPGAALVAYLRDSGGDEQELSVEQQSQAVIKWCRENGHALIRVYTDEARPGSSTIGREAFQAMLSYFRSADCQAAGVVVWKFSRFARDIDDAQFYRADLRRRGYEVHSLNDNVPTGVDGRFFEAAIDWMNQRFLDDLSSDVKRGLRHLVEAYGAVPGTPPRGFTREALRIGERRDGSEHIVHRWAPDPEWTERIRQAFELRAAGRNYREIQAATGLFASNNSYSTFFTNRLYIGELRFGDLVVPNYCAPVVDLDTWQAVQAIQENSQHRFHSADHPRRQSSQFVLSGLLHCARCGSPMNGHVISAKSARRTYYICSRRHRRRDCDAQHIPQSIVEQAVLVDLAEAVFTPENIEHIYYELINDYIKRALSADQDRIRLAKSLATARRQARNLATAIAETGHSRVLLEKLKEIERKETQIQAELAQVERYSLPEALALPTPEDIKLISQQMQAKLRTATPDELRGYLKDFVEKILVERDEKTLRGTIVYRAPPESSAPPGRGRPGGAQMYAYMWDPLGGTLYRHTFARPLRPG